MHPFAGTAYATSKAALGSLTREMAADFGPHGIRVNAIAPGEIDTAILSPGTDKIVETIPLRRLGATSEVADIIYFLCSQNASYVTGVGNPHQRRTARLGSSDWHPSFLPGIRCLTGRFGLATAAPAGLNAGRRYSTKLVDIRKFVVLPRSHVASRSARKQGLLYSGCVVTSLEIAPEQRICTTRTGWRRRFEKRSRTMRFGGLREAPWILFLRRRGRSKNQLHRIAGRASAFLLICRPRA